MRKRWEAADDACEVMLMLGEERLDGLYGGCPYGEEGTEGDRAIGEGKIRGRGAGLGETGKRHRGRVRRRTQCSKV